MTRQEVKKTILLEMIAEFNETTPLLLTNRNEYILCTSPITPSSKPSGSPWVDFMVKDNITSKVTLGTKGNRRFRRTGFIAARVYIPESEGTKEGDTLCEEIISIFEGERLGDIAFDFGDYEEIGNTSTGWFLYNIIIRFSFDETK